MAEYPQPTNEERQTRRAVTRHERFELLEHLTALLEPVMTFLGLVFLGLLLLDYTALDFGLLSADRIDLLLQVIWVVFLIDFALRLTIAPAKLAFLRHNWLAAVSLVLPFLRPLRAFRAIRAVRSLSLVRFLGGTNRGMRALRQITRGRQLVYVGLLTAVVALTGAVGVYYFDRGIAGSPIRTFGDALWWSSALVTTMNNEKYVVSTEARIVAILMRVYALSVFGYLTASIATWFIGTGDPAAGQDDSDALRSEIVSLRQEIAALRAAQADGTASEPGGDV